MTASWYKLELETRHQLEADGYWCIRPGGSKGAADVVAAKPGPVLGMPADWLLVQCKESGELGLNERRRLTALASMLRATAILASWAPTGPRGGRGVQFQELTGPGPRDRRPWTTNHAIGEET